MWRCISAAVGLYSSKGDMQAHRPKGGHDHSIWTPRVADKLFKAAGLQVPYDEDDESMMELCGNLCESIANTLKDGLSAKGFAALEVSPPTVYKIHHLRRGLNSAKTRTRSRNFLFFFLKHKALVIEWTLAPHPSKIILFHEAARQTYFDVRRSYLRRSRINLP